MEHKVNISIITSLYRPSVYLKSFLNYVSQIDNLLECELILLHNDPLEEDLVIIEKFNALNLLSVMHIKIPREGLYSSWNRGVKMASGNLIAIWNVDDIRNPESLSLQKKALENTDAVMCYGDYYATSIYGKFKKDFYEYNPNYLKLRNRAWQAHVIGCFPMWKKHIHDTVGYFDEQFKLVGDWEFQMRVVRIFDLVKANAELGFCLVDKPHRLSANRHLQYKEQTVVRLRFKLYDHLLLHYLPQIGTFKIKETLSFGIWKKISISVPKRQFEVFKEIKSLLLMPFIYTGWIIEKIIGRLYNYFFFKS